jgi:hypothetical protein
MRPKERGTNMRTRLIAVLVVLAAVAVFTTEASAMYHAGMGVFMQRDPGPRAGGPARMGAGGAPAATGRFIPRDPTGSNQYADGMNLYQYVRSNPSSGRLDPSGTIIVTVAGLGESPGSLAHIEEDVATSIGYALTALGRNYITGNTFRYRYSRIGYGGGNAKNLLQKEYTEFLKRKEKDRCSLEQFVAIGHSDGGTAIYLLLKDGSFNKATTPAYLGIIDLVRSDFGILHVNKERSHAGHASALTISSPSGTVVDNYYQSKGQPLLGWRGRYINGADENTELTDAIHYDPLGSFPDEILKNDRVRRDIAGAVGRYYAERVDKEKRPKPWDQAASEKKHGDGYGRW